MKNLKKIALVLSITITSFLSLGFVDNYFEISKNLDIFSTLYKELNILYVDETDSGELMKTAIDAMLESLDPYTTYIPESDKEDFENKKRSAKLQETLNSLHKNKVIPIVNENDTTATSEIKYGDNDRLAARVAQIINADSLIILSDVDGLYDENKKLINKKITNKIAL